MDAILSSQRGIGLILNNSELLALVTPVNILPHHASAEFAAAWLREAPDALFLEDVTAEAAQRRLRSMVAFEEAFRLFLPLFDTTLSHSLRLEIAGQLERLLNEHALFTGRLRARFYAAPFPQLSALDDALSISRSAGTIRLRGFLFGLQSRQRVIREVTIAWSQVPANLFPANLDREQVRQLFTKQGVFARLVEKLAKSGSIREFIWNEEERWETEPFAIELIKQLTLPFTERQQQQRQPVEEFEQIRAALENKTHEILGFVRLGELDRALEEARKAANSNAERIGSLSAAIFLGDLAARAKKMNAFDAQMSFAELAVQTEATNVQCWTQLADAHKCSGRLITAREVYEDILCEEPENRFAMSGCAEVLRTLGHFKESLALYDALVQKHPEDRLARTARANILARLGRFKEALDLVPSTELKSLDDFIDYHTRGMIFVQMGELSKARSIFHHGLTMEAPHSETDYFRNAYAFCCLWSNCPEDALESLGGANQKQLRPAQEILRSHALGALGRVEECAATLVPLRILPSPLVQAVATEIDARFLQHRPDHTEHWLLTQEQELLLAA
jgi:tetratricopeptide (TPR) repeat protein